MQHIGAAAMRGTRHNSERYTGGVLISSAGRRWRGLTAELRSHVIGEIPPYVASFTQIAVLIRGASVVMRRSGGVRQRTVGIRGTIGLCPMGVHENSTYVMHDIDEMLHIYLSPRPVRCACQAHIRGFQRSVGEKRRRLSRSAYRVHRRGNTRGIADRNVLRGYSGRDAG